MKILVAKLGATGDVVRTTTLIDMFDAEIIWITAEKNLAFVTGISDKVTAFTWEQRKTIPNSKYDLIINLEDTSDVGDFLKPVDATQRFGAYSSDTGKLLYTGDSKGWFDLSLISSYGREKADQLKLLNRRTYQDLLYEGLGFTFEGQKYKMPNSIETDLQGDVAISPKAGPVWPIKNWPKFDKVKSALEEKGLIVNYLPKRPTLLEHLQDVKNHRLLISGDSLPMHLALGEDIPCISLFTCTSPWEIYDYGIQRKIVSPLLEDFFYQRKYDERAASAITVEEVMRAAEEMLAKI